MVIASEQVGREGIEVLGRSYQDCCLPYIAQSTYLGGQGSRIQFRGGSLTIIVLERQEMLAIAVLILCATLTGKLRMAWRSIGRYGR